MSPGDFYVYSLILFIIIIILLMSIAVSSYKQSQNSKNLEAAIYRLIEITKESSKK
jgi:uncharacterized protein YggT (Ycf19 family)